MLPEVIAHRGLHQTVRENTIEAFELALQAGADAIELDVHATQDGIVVVHHDPDVGDYQINELTCDALRAVAFDSGFEIPKLSQVLDLAGKRAKVYVEIKAAGIELLVARCIRETETLCAVHSFDHAAIRQIRMLVPALETGILVDEQSGDPERQLETANAMDYWPSLPLVTVELVKRIHRRGGRVIAWTANKREEWDALVKSGVDGICSDDPAGLRATLNK
jgi:glycerophosphoryl diester phosphodiesterase